jgi:hypothetical protein
VFVLHPLGYENMRVYDGSMREYNRDDTPLSVAAFTVGAGARRQRKSRWFRRLLELLDANGR